ATAGSPLARSTLQCSSASAPGPSHSALPDNTVSAGAVHPACAPSRPTTNSDALCRPLFAHAPAKTSCAHLATSLRQVKRVGLHYTAFQRCPRSAARTYTALALQKSRNQRSRDELRLVGFSPAGKPGQHSRSSSDTPLPPSARKPLGGVRRRFFAWFEQAVVLFERAAIPLAARNGACQSHGVRQNGGARQSRDATGS